MTSHWWHQLDIMKLCKNKVNWLFRQKEVQVSYILSSDKLKTLFLSFGVSFIDCKQLRLRKKRSINIYNEVRFSCQRNFSPAMFFCFVVVLHHPHWSAAFSWIRWHSVWHRAVPLPVVLWRFTCWALTRGQAKSLEFAFLCRLLFNHCCRRIPAKVCRLVNDKYRH